MLLPDVRTPAPRQALFDWLRKLRLAMRSITDANRMSVRSRYSSEPKGPFLNVKKRDLMSHRIQLVACFTQWTHIATTKSSSSFVPTAVAMCISNDLSVLHETK